MSARIDTANRIPGHNVTQTLADLQVAVRANPGFSIIRICADARLSRVLDPALCLAATKAQSDGAEIQVFSWFGLGFAAFRSVAARHLVPTEFV
jgi:hypothetical protein